jgi:ParB family chromosome partitioning protein
LSVRKVEAIVKALNEGKPAKEASEKGLDPVRKYEMNKIQQRLASHFGTKVGLKADERNRGEIKIPFNSATDLNRILEILEII